MIARRLLSLLAVSAAVVLAGCDKVTVVEVLPNRVEVSPAALTLDFLESSTLSARVLDADGRHLPGYSVAWSVTDPSVVSLHDDGTVQAIAEGTARITAAVEAGPSGSIDVTVAPTRALVVDRETLEFTVVQGAPPPPSVDVAVGSTGGSVHDLEVRVSSSGQGWVETALSSPVTDATLSVRADPMTLEPGAHEAVVILTSPVTRPLEIPLRITVVEAAPPSLVVTPNLVVFQMDEGSTTPLTEVLSISTDGASLAGVDWTVDYRTGPAGWLSVELAADTTPTTAQLVMTPSPALAAGDHLASLTIAAPGSIPATIDVTLSVVEPQDDGSGDDDDGSGDDDDDGSGNDDDGSGGDDDGSGGDDDDGSGGDDDDGSGGDDPTPADSARFVLDVSAITFTTVAGGADPAPRTLDVTSDASPIDGLAAVVSYADGGEEGWLDATFDTTSTPATLEVTAAVGDLPPGSHEAEITISGSDAAPVTVPVTFEVSEPVPVIGVSPTSLEIEVDAGIDPPAEELTVTALSGSVSGLAVAVSYPEGAPTGWLDVALSSSEAPATATVGFDVDGLAGGEYTAEIILSATGADDVVIPVEFGISEEGLGISVAIPTVELVLPLGGALLGLVPIPVLDVGATPVQDLTVDVEFGTGEPDWLTARLNAPALPGLPSLLTLDAGAGLGSLSTGTYSADVIVRSELFTSVEARVRLILHVLDPNDLFLALDPGGVALEATVDGGVVQTSADVRGLLGALGALGPVTLTSEIEYLGDASGWLEVSITNGLLNLPNPDTPITLSADATGLPVGRHEAIVEVHGAVLGLPLRVGTGRMRVFFHVTE